MDWPVCPTHRPKANLFILIACGIAFLGAGGFFVYNLYSLLMLYSAGSF
ncbi:MAG: hypothetical protein P4L77_11685 [Sulfuriferula sp.]|nr:hypothetical protein [Sulfuriferula sp.]